MTYYDELQSSLSALGYQDGFTDLLGIVRSGNAVETVLTDQPSQIILQNVIAASSFNLNLEQKSVSDKRFAGEGPDPSILSLDGIKIRATATLPMYAPSTGWVDPVFANLYDLVRWSYWGTPEAAVGTLTSIANIGSSILYTDNISEFVALSTPFTINIGIRPSYNYSGSSSYSSGGFESIVVSSVNKSTLSLNLLTPTQYYHGISTQISATLTTFGQGPLREPSFSLLSWREGMLSPCLVNKLTIDATVGEPVKITAEFVALKVFRDRQIQFASQVAVLAAQAATSAPVRIVDSISTTLSPSSSLSGVYGMSTAIGDPLFGGFQSLDMDPMLITGFSVTVDNKLQETYSLNSLSTGGKRLRENNYPYALVSGGRTVSGEIKLRTTLSAWGSIERLAGPSSLAGGGLIVDYGVCNLTLPEIGWSPISNFATSDQPVNRTLKWTLLADQRNALPDLDYSNQT